MQCRLVRDMACDPSPEFPNGIKCAGTVIDHCQAFWLVKMGIAESVDDECRTAAAMSQDAFANAQYAYERADRGIQPEDFVAYDAGIMDGYDAQGNWIPGENYAEWRRKEDRKISQLILPEDE